MASEIATEIVLKPSQKLLQDISSWTRGERIDFATQLLINEAASITGSGYLKIEIKALSGKLCDYSVSTNWKLNELKDL